MCIKNVECSSSYEYHFRNVSQRKCSDKLLEDKTFSFAKLLHPIHHLNQHKCAACAICSHTLCTHTCMLYFENYYCVSKLQVWLASFFLLKSFTGEWNKWKCVTLCSFSVPSVHGWIWATMMTIRCNMLKYAQKLQARHAQTHTHQLVAIWKRDTTFQCWSDFFRKKNEYSKTSFKACLI